MITHPCLCCGPRADAPSSGSHLADVLAAIAQQRLVIAGDQKFL